ncbi:MAG: DNA repair protein RecO (recombination protein O) [Chloroflexi bacterium]|jgi:DNA repair protein RecO (recombination protein O)|nr:MAG: DNA repair protein RecO (recombination protein O) [Chloroflexota bacterium]
MAKPRIYTTTALVLKYRNYGEADRFVTLLSRNLGQLQGFAKGVRRSTSKLTGHLELFYKVRITLAVGRNTDVVTEVQILKTLGKINNNLDTMSCALTIMELALNISTEGPGNENIYDLLDQTLNRLNITDESNVDKLLTYYQLNILFISGLSPEFKECVECGSVLKQQDQLYSAPAGGIICPKCAPKQTRSLVNLSVNAIKVLRFIGNSDVEDVEQLSVPKNVVSQINDVLNRHIDHHIDGKVRSRAFLKGIK